MHHTFNVLIFPQPRGFYAAHYQITSNTPVDYFGEKIMFPLFTCILNYGRPQLVMFLAPH